MTRSVLAIVLALAATTGACTASVTEECIGGPCLPAELESITVGATSAASSGSGAGGGGGAPFVCNIEQCDKTVVPAPAGVVPCEVQAIMEAKCYRCHDSPLPTMPAPGPPVVQPGPFSLVSLADIYAEYYTLGTPRWAKMHDVITTNFMPLQPPKLTDAEKQVMFEWLCECAPPAPEGTVCE